VRSTFDTYRDRLATDPERARARQELEEKFRRMREAHEAERARELQAADQ
jgi:hypothetical protein